MLGERTSQSRKDKKKVNPLFFMGSGLKLYHTKGMQDNSILIIVPNVLSYHMPC